MRPREWVNGRVDEFVTVARRSGRDWYLGGITDGDARELEIPLEFLGAGRYLATIYSDEAGGNPTRTAIEVKEVDSGTRLKVKLAGGGGVAIVFVK